MGARNKLFRLAGTARIRQETVGGYGMEFGEGNGRFTAWSAFRNGLLGVIHRHGNGPGTAGENTLQPRPGKTFATVEIHPKIITLIETLFQFRFNWDEPKLD